MGDESRLAAPAVYRNDDVSSMSGLWKRSFDSDESRLAAPAVYRNNDVSSMSGPWKRSFDSDESRQADPVVYRNDDVSSMSGLWKRSFDSDESRLAAPAVHRNDDISSMSGPLKEKRKPIFEVVVPNMEKLSWKMVYDFLSNNDEAKKIVNKLSEMVGPLPEGRQLLY